MVEPISKHNYQFDFILANSTHNLVSTRSREVYHAVRASRMLPGPLPTQTMTVSVQTLWAGFHKNGRA